MAPTKTEVDAAIKDILLGGQSYTLSDGRSFTHANLKELRALRSELDAEESSEAEGGVYQKVQFERPA